MTVQDYVYDVYEIISPLPWSLIKSLNSNCFHNLCNILNIPFEKKNQERKNEKKVLSLHLGLIFSENESEQMCQNIYTASASHPCGKLLTHKTSI